MNKLRRFYNQNTKEIWIAILIIIFVISIIQLLNGFSEKKIEEEIQNAKNEVPQETKYKNESDTLILGGNVSKESKEKYGTVIDQFLKHCQKGEIEQAYQFLSEDCKELLYPTQQVFENKYWKTKFAGNKIYSFQSWTTVKNIIYYVKIFDDMLSTGVASTQNYAEDYITIIKKDGEYKLNINSYITKKQRNAEKEKDGIKIKVDSTRVYMEYEIYFVTIENLSDQDILLDTKKGTNTLYVKDENGAMYEALLHENKEEDFLIRAGKKKTIPIKFSNNYQAGTKTVAMVFSDIIPDYQQYMENEQTYTDRLEIEVRW